MIVNFFLNTPFPGLHQVDIEDAWEEWSLPDDTYDINLIEHTPHRLRFEIIGGEHDGKQVEIRSNEDLDLTQTTR